MPSHKPAATGHLKKAGVFHSRKGSGRRKATRHLLSAGCSGPSCDERFPAFCFQEQENEVDKVIAPKKDTFAIIPTRIIERKDLSCKAKMLVASVYYHLWGSTKCWPSIKRLSVLSSCSRASVKRAIDELEEKKVLKVERRTTTDGMNKTSVYTFL